MRTPIRFGDHFGRLRKKRGIYQRVLLKKLRLKSPTTQSISNWEKGRSLPAPEKLPLIRKALHLKVDEYLILEDCYWKERRSRDEDKSFSEELRPKIEAELERIVMYKVPLFGSKDTLNPASVLEDKQKWEGGYTEVPFSLQGGRVFAFKVSDPAMVPKYNPEDILFCDLDLPLEEGKPVVACVKGQVFCRIYERQGEQFTFKAKDEKVKVVMVSKEKKEQQVKWWCRVSMRQSNER